MNAFLKNLSGAALALSVIGAGVVPVSSVEAKKGRTKMVIIDNPKTKHGVNPLLIAAGAVAVIVAIVVATSGDDNPTSP